MVGKPQLFGETALLGRDLAEDLGFQNVNRPIEIKIKSGNDDFSKQLKVSGITSSSPFGGLNQILIVHIDLLRDLLNLEKGSSTSIIVKLKQPEKAVEVAYWIKQRYPDYEVLTTNEAAGWVEQAGTVTSFINLVGYAGMIASALAVITVLTMMVSGKTPAT